MVFRKEYQKDKCFFKIIPFVLEYMKIILGNNIDLRKKPRSFSLRGFQINDFVVVLFVSLRPFHRLRVNQCQKHTMRHRLVKSLRL